MQETIRRIGLWWTNKTLKPLHFLQETAIGIVDLLIENHLQKPPQLSPARELCSFRKPTVRKAPQALNYVARAHFCRGLLRRLLALGEAFDEVGIVVARREIGVGHNPLVQRNGGVDAFHHKQVKRPLHAADGFGAVAAVGNELGDQRVVVGRHEPP